MNIHPDFEELLRLLEEHGVEYMIVGGYAVAIERREQHAIARTLSVSGGCQK